MKTFNDPLANSLDDVFTSTERGTFPKRRSPWCRTYLSSDASHQNVVLGSARLHPSTQMLLRTSDAHSYCSVKTAWHLETPPTFPKPLSLPPLVCNLSITLTPHTCLHEFHA